jgi:hypothetical protein
MVCNGANWRKSRFGGGAEWGGKKVIVRISMRNYQLYIAAFLAERSQIVQFFQWLH